MKYTKISVKLALFTAVSALTHIAFPQASPAGTQRLQLSAFAGATGTFTNLEGGKNLAITAGADLTFLFFRRFLPSFEARGTYPIDEGHISSQKNFLLGPGQIDYLPSGFVYGNTLYIQSNTVVYSPGVGLDYNLTHNLAIKGDVQFQHWNTPVTASGTIHPTAVTLGVVYNFDFNRGHRHQH